MYGEYAYIHDDLLINFINCRAAHQLWSETLNEYLCVDISQYMGDMAKSLRTGTSASSFFIHSLL